MALTPIPYTKNWKDVFGSQYVPTEANAAAASKIDAPAITSLTVTAAGLATAVVTRAGAGKIDWGDGTVATMASGSANLTHQYTRMGDYGVTCYTDADPKNTTVKHLRVSSLS